MCKHREEEADPSAWTQHIDPFISICHPVNPPRAGDWNHRILKVPFNPNCDSMNIPHTAPSTDVLGREERGYLKPDPKNLNQESSRL